MHSSSRGSCRSTFDASSFMDFKDENNALLALITNARNEVERARCAFATAGWKGRKEGHTKTVEFLDYIDFNYKTRTAARIFQTLTHDRAGRLILGGDVFAGYLLSEQVELHQTSVFAHTMDFDELKAKGIVKAKFKAATVREATARALLKLAKLVPKVCEIAIRRRLGAEYTVASADNVGNGRCFGCGKLIKESLLRKKHVCYICCHHTCGSCSMLQDVEVLVGVNKSRQN
ncbi:unnamed protein product [Peronospora destructor]|uniref:Uncharacterized protein n=1 Tax=Peronospora destructor TaxID=86335 RepID=A0AAV0V620_9STRA|nr:unnamed protein product [Peronospora destructor]